jgi:predicted RNA-binding protein YlqC (UPF0109 family)
MAEIGVEESYVDDNIGNRIVGGYVRSVVEKIVKALVKDPDSVRAELFEEKDGVRIEVTVNPADKGRVIGKQGKIAKALRTLAMAAGSKEGIRVNVEITGD